MADFLAAAEVRLWGQRVGALAEDARGRIVFEYAAPFRRSGLEISPRHLPLSIMGPVSFPALARLDAFHGLPGVFADALPDRFGNAVIAAYFARQGKSADALSPIQRLLYIGTRAMGALEFHPAIDLPATPANEEALHLAELVREARRVVSGKIDVALPEIIQVGASAGGARPKAIVLLNRAAGELRSGTATPQPGDEPWIIKFDGVGDVDRPDNAARSFNRIEFACTMMARAAGIRTPETALLRSGKFAHFLTRRFDRDLAGRMHLHSLGGIDHADFNAPGTYSYEQYLRVCLDLKFAPADVAEAFRRMVFNVIAVNQDDHVKNFSFIMGTDGVWQLAPAYDLTFARGAGFTRTHQLTLAGKVADFTRADLLSVGAQFGVKRDGATIVDEVAAAVAQWPRFAGEAGVPKGLAGEIGRVHRIVVGMR